MAVSTILSQPNKFGGHKQNDMTNSRFHYLTRRLHRWLGIIDDMGNNTPFFRTEDFWAVVLGGFFLLASLGVFYAILPNGLPERVGHLEQQTKKEEALPFKTVAWHEANAALSGVCKPSGPVALFIKKLAALPNRWTDRPAEAFYKKEKKGERAAGTAVLQQARLGALQAERAATGAGYADTALNDRAIAAIAHWQALLANDEKTSAQRKAGTFSLPHAAGLFLLLLLLFGAGARVQGTAFHHFAKGFSVIFLLALVSLALAGQKNLHDLGIEYAAWAIFLGMLISNTIGTPRWAAGALKTEFYIKTGLIVMGAEILFNKILAIGLPGIFVAWVVTPIVLVTTFWFGQKVLKIASKPLNITISADMSVCGVSAAVATAAASRATREELTVAIGLSMVFTAVMMILMPVAVKFLGLPEVLGGAWIGGTVDSSGAVVAAGAALGDKAMHVAATIKMIQNILIGFVAFGVATWFAAKVERQAGGPKVGIGEIWRRFPKFILGFIGASILFSVLYALLGISMANAVIEEGVLGSFTKNLRTWLFCLAFASIGLSTDFRVLRHHFTSGKPLLLYVCGQTLNILLTLLMAWVMFYKVFPGITADI